MPYILQCCLIISPSPSLFHIPSFPSSLFLVPSSISISQASTPSFSFCSLAIDAALQPGFTSKLPLPTPHWRSADPQVTFFFPHTCFALPSLPPPAALEAQEHQRPVGPCWVSARPPAKPPSGSLPSSLLSAPYSTPRTPRSLPPKSALHNPCRNLTLPLTRTLKCICQYSWIQSWWCTVT